MLRLETGLTQPSRVTQDCWKDPLLLQDICPKYFTSNATHEFPQLTPLRLSLLLALKSCSYRSAAGPHAALHAEIYIHINRVTGSSNNR